MNTPICDFVRRYAESEPIRLHMPGHKGRGNMGVELMDITEIDGADSLYEAKGIIAESEKNASELFGAHTFYSTEGSSQCIRAMLYLAVKYAKARGIKPLVLAGRNAHKSFLSAAALLDFEVNWIYPDADESYLSCLPNAKQLEDMIADEKPAAVYLTSPDYLGNTVDIAQISEVCRKNGVLLLVDNAHGAYLKFLAKSLHPIDLGADICCDSAHKTLPVLGGGAYLHISKSVFGEFAFEAKNALSIFGSTSPSYLILQSLDAANAYLANGYREKLSSFLGKLDKLRSRLIENGYTVISNEPLKLTISCKPYGLTGCEMADILAKQGIVCEFCDRDFLTLMFTPQLCDGDIKKLQDILLGIPKGVAINALAPKATIPERVMSVREAMLSPCEEVSVEESVGRVLAFASVSCPPAVPIVVCGERIDASAKERFEYYGINSVTVVK